MKVSLNWLRDLVALPPGVDADAVAAVLTDQGLEVEGIERRGRDLTGVVVADVLASRPHPNADKLTLVRVRAGSREEEVVCGAPNVPGGGGRVCWALPGATLPGGRAIEAREVRGVPSPGMLCSEPELGTGERGDGILILPPSAEPGSDFATALGVADDVLVVNVTPNRPDALCHLGVARELAAHFAVPLRLPAPPDVAHRADGPPADVQIADPDACPRYVARFVTGLRVTPSPLAMRLRLAACGMRAVSNLVDVTNYVLLETGHPLHAFDLAKISGGVTVRRARPGERMTTLDGQGRALDPEDVVIADSRGPVALAGVMGGAHSEVSASTKDVLLEAATFDPGSVRRTARRLGLQSEASYRFARGVDAGGVPAASLRAAVLLAELGGGALLDVVVDRYPRPVAQRKVRLTIERLRRVTGVGYDRAFAARQLGRLGWGCKIEPDAVVAAVPTSRPDVAIEEDLIEEVIRLGEYGRAPDEARVRTNAVSAPNPEAPADRARDLLAAAGLTEVVTWGFVSRSALRAASGSDTGDPGGGPAIADGIAVDNPLSADYEVMRTTLLPGLCDALGRNLARATSDVALFEVGTIVRRNPSGPPAEATVAAGIMAGRADGWLKRGESLDFFDLKHVVVDLLAGFGVAEPVFAPATKAAFLHPGVAAAAWARWAAGAPAGEPLGLLGELDPRVARKLGIEARALYFEVSLDRLAEAGRLSSADRTEPPPRFPAVARDLSFWVDRDVLAGEIGRALLAAQEPLLRSAAVLEDFRDPSRVPVGKKGMLWSMTYRADDRTLTDEEADAAHARVVGALGAAGHAIQIR